MEVISSKYYVDFMPRINNGLDELKFWYPITKKIFELGETIEYQDELDYQYLFKKNGKYVITDMLISNGEQKLTAIRKPDILKPTKFEPYKYEQLKVDKVICFPIGETLLPKKVLFNEEEKKTTLLYKSNKPNQKYRSVSVKAIDDDVYDKEKGFLIAFFQETTGMSKSKYREYMNKILNRKPKE